MSEKWGKSRLKLTEMALTISPGRWGKTTPKILDFESQFLQKPTSSNPSRSGVKNPLRAIRVSRAIRVDPRSANERKIGRKLRKKSQWRNLFGGSWESLNGGLANGGLRCLSTIVHDCLRLSSFRDESSPQKWAPKRPQKCTIVDDCAQIAESGLKPPFGSPHLDFPKGGDRFRQSEVSKRGWRTEGVGATKSLKGHRFRPLFCTFFSYAPLGEGGHISGEFIGLFGGLFLAKFSAKPVANFRRSLEGDFRASFAGQNRQKHFHQNSTAYFTIKLHYEVLGCGGPYLFLSPKFSRRFSACGRESRDQ